MESNHSIIDKKERMVIKNEKEKYLNWKLDSYQSQQYTA